MSRFYGSIEGNRGMATRQGTASSGMYGHIRGWHIGASVVCYENEKGEDCVRVQLTGGSMNPSPLITLGAWKLEGGVLTKEED